MPDGDRFQSLSAYCPCVPDIYLTLVRPQLKANYGDLSTVCWENERANGNRRGGLSNNAGPGASIIIGCTAPMASNSQHPVRIRNLTNDDFRHMGRIPHNVIHPLQFTAHGLRHLRSFTTPSALVLARAIMPYLANKRSVSKDLWVLGV